MHKNKLTSILRQAKKDYYNEMLNENKNNIRGTWKFLNEVIGNNSIHTSLPQYFTTGEDRIEMKQPMNVTLFL